MKELTKKLNFNWFDLSVYRNEIMGIATLMIVVFHFCQMSNFISNGILSRLFQTLCAGVEIFIILSGMGLYFSYEKNPDIKTFYKKRVLRVYVVYLMLSLPYNIWWAIENNRLKLLIINWLFPNYTFGNARDVWYVPFIMAMYFAFPFIYKFFLKKSQKFVCISFSAISAVCYIVYYFLKKADLKWFNGFEIAFFRLPIFLLACYIAVKVYNKEKIKLKYGIMVAVSVMLVPVISYFCTEKLDIIAYRAVDSLSSLGYIAVILLFLKITDFDGIKKFLCGFRIFHWSCILFI